MYAWCISRLPSALKYIGQLDFRVVSNRAERNPRSKRFRITSLVRTVSSNAINDFVLYTIVYDVRGKKQEYKLLVNM